jgi:amino acid transporter
VPFYCVGIVLLIALLSFLQLSENSAVVLNWFVSLVTASQLINFSVMCFTFLRFYKACHVQGLDRNTLPYKGRFQPYAAWYGLVTTFIMTFVGGYTVFLKGQWDLPSFLFSYLMVRLSFLSPLPVKCFSVLKKNNAFLGLSLPRAVRGLEAAQEDAHRQESRGGSCHGSG